MRIDEATFIINDLKYEYENGGLTVIGYDPVFFTGTATVISKLIYNGRAMNVVGIGRNAFYGCSSLTFITIGSSVTSIGNKAFAYCTNLTDVYCSAENVPSTGYDAFEGSSISSATLHVPAGSIDNYKSKSPWSKFGSIVAIE